MAVLSLLSLPVELLRQICGSLPSRSALDFLRVCRHAYLTCNDWTVWRTIFMWSVLRRYDPTLLPAGRHDGWKRYVVAAALATRACTDWNTNDLEAWIPQFAALCHPSVIEDRVLIRSQFIGKVLSNPLITRSSQEAVLYSSDELQVSTLHELQLAQAATFAVTVRYLSFSSPGESPVSLLRSVPWVTTTTLPGLSELESRKLVTIQHILANQVVGFFCASLRAASAASYPSASAIPFSRQMDLPQPFSPMSIETFATCHLATMADPKFFIESTWIGCFCVLGNYGLPFNAIGGRWADSVSSPEDTNPLTGLAGTFPYGRGFEDVIRFRVVEEAGDGSFQLQSNNFYSEAELHNLYITIQRETGCLTIRHWHRMNPIFMTTEGVITPFGVVSWLQLQGRWMWLWKVDWL